MKIILKNKTILLLVISVIGTVFGFFFTNSYRYNLCFRDLSTLTFDASCAAGYEKLGDPLFYGFFALSIIFFILLFLPHTFKAWKKFALWFIPLATLLFIFYPEPGSGDYFSPYPEQVFQWVSAFYVGASLGIILTALISDIRERKGHAQLRWWWYIVPAVLLGYGAITVLPTVLQLLWF